MVWNDEETEKHVKAAEILCKIKDRAFNFIRGKEDVNEYDIQQFIISEFAKEGMISDHDPPITAFNESAATPHYFAKVECKKISDNSLILIDLWAKLDERLAPYADITWMGYKGEEVNEEVQKAFDMVLEARDECVKFIERKLEEGEMPLGKEAHEVVCKVFEKHGVKENFVHGTGHSIGYDNAHGEPPYINKSQGDGRLLKNMGYTIEPGLYFKDKFGVRSEINFYINDDMEMIITTEVQEELVKV